MNQDQDLKDQILMYLQANRIVIFFNEEAIFHVFREYLFLSIIAVGNKSTLEFINYIWTGINYAFILNAEMLWRFMYLIRGCPIHCINRMYFMFSNY